MKKFIYIVGVPCWIWIGCDMTTTIWALDKPTLAVLAALACANMVVTMLLLALKDTDSRAAPERSHGTR